MTGFEKFIKFLSAEVKTTLAPFGVYHLVFFLIIIAVAVILCVKLKDCSDKTFRLTLFIIWLVIFLFEMYKQLVAPYSFVDEKAIYSYNFNDIPYQFCSTIHYVLLPIVFLKDGKVRDAITSFTAFYVFLAGFMVTVFPDQLKSLKEVGLCIQTMVHHGAQVVAGAFIAVRMRKKINLKFFLSGTIVFLAFLALAVILNFALSPENVGGGVINFFYISPYHNCPLPILGDIRKSVPWIIFFLIYFIGFMLVAGIIALGFYYLGKLIKTEKQ